MSDKLVVYALQDEDGTEAVFSTEELALEAQRQYGYGSVVAWQIDELAELVLKKLPRFQMKMRHDGTLDWIRETKGSFVSEMLIAFDYSCMYANCHAESVDAAIAYANEQRLKVISEGRWPEPNAYWAPFNAANGFAVYPQPSEAAYV